MRNGKESYMGTIRNIEPWKGQTLTGLIDWKAHQVVSMAMSKSEAVQMTLLAFAEGENVSEEMYFGDTVYLMAEGQARIRSSEHTVELKAGGIAFVPAGALHEIDGCGSFKILQITIQK